MTKDEIITELNIMSHYILNVIENIKHDKIEGFDIANTLEDVGITCKNNLRDIAKKIREELNEYMIYIDNNVSKIISFSEIKNKYDAAHIIARLTTLKLVEGENSRYYNFYYGLCYGVIISRLNLGCKNMEFDVPVIVTSAKTERFATQLDPNGAPITIPVKIIKV